MTIRSARSLDAAAITSIYNHYVQTSHATFELEFVDPSEMDQRIRDSIDHGYPFLIAEEDGQIAGYAYGRPFRPRPGYRHTVEIAVYVRPGYERRGIGQKLYEALIPKLFVDGFHTIIATIALPNDASVRLHERLGFEKVGLFRQVGRKFDRWVDVGYWQLINHTD